jgi:hypothetical protein
MTAQSSRDKRSTAGWIDGDGLQVAERERRERVAVGRALCLLWLGFALLFFVDLPPRRRLRAGLNVGDVRVDAGLAKVSWSGLSRSFRATRILVFPLCDSSLFTLSLYYRWSRSLCHVLTSRAVPHGSGRR